MAVSVAIIGSGPSGFYTADALIRTGIDCTIDVIERLPVPFGLVRYGIAPDHQSTKRVSRNFDKTARRDPVRFFGNVEVGGDVSIAELRELYDALVLAVGAPVDRPLGIPGEDKKGVYGSAAFVGWYNAHPDFRALDPDLQTETVCVIGNGNVALDVARLLSRTREELEASDMPDYAVAEIAKAPIKDIHLVGRRGPVEAKFTIGELREMGELTDAIPVVRPEDLPESLDAYEESERRLKARNIEVLRSFVGRQAEQQRKRVFFDFYAAPVEILGTDRVSGVRFERTRLEGGRAVGTGETWDMPCGVVVPAIGYRASPLEELPFDSRGGLFVNERGKIDEGVYAVGWAMRGPTGVVGSNRADGKLVAERIVAEVPGGKPGRDGLCRLLEARGCRTVDYQDWLKIEAAEGERAAATAPRRKFVTVDDMLACLGGG